MLDWAHAGPSIVAAFLAALVEFVEALTIILAVGTVRGWRSALMGSAAGVLALTVLVLAFGPALQRVPIHVLQLVIGILLLLFGMRWLRKAALRSAGIIGLHDEAAIYAKQTKKLRADGTPAPERLDALGFLTTFKAVILEGLEVVFIVIAVGAVNHTLMPASIGAAAAGMVVILLGVMLHKPLAKVPENALKYIVGVLLSAFGTFWIGEGFGYAWPGEDLSLVAVAVGFLVISWIGVMLIRRGKGARDIRTEGARMKVILTALHEIYGLFVEDVTYTAAIVAWLLIAAFVLPRVAPATWLPALWFAGLALILLENMLRSARQR